MSYLNRYKQKQAQVQIANNVPIIPSDRKSLTKIMESGRDINKKEEPFKEKDQQITRIIKLLKMNLHHHVSKPEMVVKIVSEYKQSNGKPWVESTQGQYISDWSTFISRCGHQMLNVSLETLCNSVKQLQTSHKNKREPSIADRKNGKPSIREIRRGVYKIGFLEMKNKAEEFYKETEYMYSSLDLCKDDYNVLLDAFILMLYTHYYDIRSAWCQMTRDFNPMTGNGIVVTDERVLLVFNRRKNNNHSFSQIVNEETAVLIRRWFKFTKKRISQEAHLLVDYEGNPLTSLKMRPRVIKTFQHLINKPIGISDIRRAQVTYLTNTITDPMVLRTIAAEFHHSRVEHDLYFKNVEVDDSDFVEGDSDNDDDEPDLFGSDDDDDDMDIN